MAQHKKSSIMKILLLVLVIISIYYVIQGVWMHSQVNTEEDKFHTLQAEYWNQNKNIRDQAATGSALNQQLVEVKNYPSTLLKLKLVGIGKILTGIFISLIGILIALVSMPSRLKEAIKSK